MTAFDAACVLDARALVGEGAVWCAQSQGLLWVDVWGRKLHRFDPSTGTDSEWTLPEKTGCVAPIDANRVALGLETGIYLFDLATARLEPYFLVENGGIHNRCNDSTVDPSGRLWCGTMNLAGLAGPATGDLYAIGTGKDTTRGTIKERGLFLPNGLACSPDGRTLYLSDSHPSVQAVWKYDLDPASGHITNRALFCDFKPLDGRPDGATVDADGCYWICAVDGGAVLRLTPQGKIDRRIKLPVSKPSKLAFGGSRLDTLYVTSIGIPAGDAKAEPMAGGLFAIHVGPLGLPGTPMHINE